MLFFRPGDEFRNSEIPGIGKPGHFCAISGNSVRPENMFLKRNASWVRKSTFSDIFRNVKFAKVQKCKKRKMQNVPKTHWNFGLSKIGCGDLSKHWKVSKMTPKIPVHTRAHFFSRNSARHFRVFDFQLRIEVKFRKKAFSIFLEKFSLFCVLPAGGRRPIFTWGENLNSLFFRKVRNTFSVLGPILCCFYWENPSGRKWRRPDYPYRPLVAWGSVFLTLFCSDSRLWNGVKKKVNGFAVLLYRIWK
jgi:hypothetical protein